MKKRIGDGALLSFYLFDDMKTATRVTFIIFAL